MTFSETRSRDRGNHGASRTTAGVIAVALTALLAMPLRAQGPEPRVFATPDGAVRALLEAAKASDLDAVIAVFGSDGRDLASSSDAATARLNRDTFVVAMGEGWRLADAGPGRQELVLGNEAWPFPVPLMKAPKGWMFNTAAGKEEVLTRRIGRNELAVIGICETYVKAQRLYARSGHDGKPAGRYARRFTSAPGTQNGLYWPVKRDEPHSPFGPLVADAAKEGRPVGDGQKPPVPFHGYHFRVLEAQGPAAAGGARSYLVGGELTGGFGLVAWPADYGDTGIMTFIVNQDGVAFEKDLGSETGAAATRLTEFDPGTTWERVEPQDAP